MNSILLFHIILAVVTSVVIGVSGLYAVILTFQDYALRRHWLCPWLSRLAPLESREKRLFQITVLGFILLSILMVSSLYFFHGMLWSVPWLFQKTVLVVLAWIMFATVLWGRWQFGWRGRVVTYCIASGVLLLLFVYLISHIAMEG